MPSSQTAKLFQNGASQAVRLPVEFRFEGNEVYISRDSATGDVILSSRPGAAAWQGFFAETPDCAAAPDAFPEFMADRPMNHSPVEEDIFATDRNN